MSPHHHHHHHHHARHPRKRQAFPATQDHPDSRTHLDGDGPHYHTAFVVALMLNTLFVAIELWAGWYADSLALIADAIHNLGDVLALGVAWLGYSLSFRPPSDRFTYGMGRMSIYATVFNGLTLVASGAWILKETIERLSSPVEPMGWWVITVAAIGLAINLGTAMALHRGSKHDVNIRGAWLHMMGDAGVSAIVMIGGFVMLYQPAWIWLDPSLSGVLAVAIIWSAWPLVTQGAHMAMDGVPSGIKTAEVRDFILSYEGVESIHALRIWALSTTRNALSCHLVLAEGPAAQQQPAEAFLEKLRDALAERFDFGHITLQIENPASTCIS